MNLPTKADADALETMIDRLGLTEVLNLTAAICAGKAEHVRSAWQDSAVGREWDRIGERVSATADRVDSTVCG